MKLHASIFVAGAFSAVQAAIFEAPVYIFNDKSTASASHDLPSLSPETARLVLADRLGLSQYHSLLGANEFTIQHLNQLGALRSQHLLNDEPEQGRRSGRLLLVIEGIETPQGTYIFIPI